jgi:hypothetical protein
MTEQPGAYTNSATFHLADQPQPPMAIRDYSRMWFASDLRPGLRRDSNPQDRDLPPAAFGVCFGQRKSLTMIGQGKRERRGFLRDQAAKAQGEEAARA